jgi:hypothetical protein
MEVERSAARSCNAGALPRGWYSPDQHLVVKAYAEVDESAPFYESGRSINPRAARSIRGSGRTIDHEEADHAVRNRRRWSPSVL